LVEPAIVKLSLIRYNPNRMKNDIQKAIQIIKDGGIVIYPTDTAFGIGCRIDKEESIKRLFHLRRRPETQATPVLTSSIHMLEPFLPIIDQEVITKLVEPYWPGALTIVLPCYPEKISSLVRGGTQTLGIRIPNHLTALSLIEGVGVPIIGTSANFKGHPTPYTFDNLDPELVKLVDYVVPGECYSKLASTVIDVTQKPWKILRQGALELAL